jgi:hypothetical protein
MLALPPPLGRGEEVPPPAGNPGERLGAGKVFDISIVSPEFPLAFASVAKTDSGPARMAAIGGRERSERLWTAVACYRFGAPGLPGALK